MIKNPNQGFFVGGGGEGEKGGRGEGPGRGKGQVEG